MSGKSRFSNDDADRQRPDVPEFWEFSEILLALDAEMSDTTGVIEKIIPVEVLRYVAWTRTNNALAMMMASGVDPRAILPAGWMDGFVAGARWAQRKPHE